MPQNINEEQRNELLRKYLEQPLSFHEALVYHMKDRNMSVEQLAYEADMSTRTLARWRHEELNSYPLERLVRVFQCLKLEPIFCYSMFRKAGIRLLPSNPEDMEVLKACEEPFSEDDEVAYFRL